MMPTILLFFPFQSPENKQTIIAAWQPAPVFVSCFTYFFAKSVDVSKKLSGCKKRSTANDIFHLRALYQTTGAIAACIHLSVIIGCLISNDISLIRLFVPKDSFAQVETLADGVFCFFQNDFLLVVAASFLWSLVTVGDLYRTGLTHLDWKCGFCYLVAGFVVIGPGATAAALWFWREGVLSRRTAVKS